jgi:hypothetical protein
MGTKSSGNGLLGAISAAIKRYYCNQEIFEMSEINFCFYPWHPEEASRGLQKSGFSIKLFLSFVRVLGILEDGEIYPPNQRTYKGMHMRVRPGSLVTRLLIMR